MIPRRELKPAVRLLVAGVLVAAVALVLVLRQRGLLGPWEARLALPWRPAQAGLLGASGIIQADEVSIASEYGGRIAEMPVAEGDRVAAGQLLVRLDTALLDAQLASAEAAVASAEASLAQTQAGSRPGQISVAEAQLRQAQAARTAARQAVTDTRALVANPQDINLQIAVKEAQLASARHQLAAAVAQKDAAENGMNRGGGAVQWMESWGLSVFYWPEQVLDLSYILYWQGWIGVNAAGESLQGLEESLANLRDQQKDPQELQAKAGQAQAGLAQAEAQVAAAQAQLDGLKAGATAEQLAAQQARVGQAQAALSTLRRQRSLRDIVAPLGGTVVEVVSRPGEVAAPGAAILTVANVDTVALRVYVPQTRLGQVHLGQAVQVSVDSLPGRTLRGQVSRIADQAEFTPRNVATKEERVNLVFAVEIRIENRDGALKPGMPADAIFEP